MFKTLTAAQKQVVITTGRKVVVKACPGSGKTYCVAARLAYKLKSWDKSNQGIAALSFTNVAWQEIRDSFKKSHGEEFLTRYPHFIGTIDSFINQFIFLPFGHKAIGCCGRPVMVGEPYGRWTGGRNFYQKRFCDLAYDINGNLGRKYPQAIRNTLWEDNITKFENAKKAMLRAGIATQDDSNYISLQLLRKFPVIAKALAKRFPVLIIDEAQDTTNIQMGIIDCLLRAGLKEIMLVGDPDQAIFEWNEANPDLFMRKMKEWRSSALELNQNRRSSQNICTFSSVLSSFESPFQSICYSDGTYKCSFQPEIIGYTDATTALSHFKDVCQRFGVGLGSKVALCRSRSLVADLLSSGASSSAGSRPESPWNDGLQGDISSCLAKAKFSFSNGEIVSGMHRCEKAMVMLYKKQSRIAVDDIRDAKDEIGVAEWRKNVYKLLTALPDVGLSIKQWVDDANRTVAGFCPDVDFTSSFKDNFKDVAVSDHFKKYEPGSFVDDIEISTIHGAKGRTIDAVLVILKTKTGSGKHYKTLLEEVSKQDVKTLKPEELRTVYVGITRPRKVLVLAVPEANVDRWKAFFGLEPIEEEAAKSLEIIV